MRTERVPGAVGRLLDGSPSIQLELIRSEISPSGYRSSTIALFVSEAARSGVVPLVSKSEDGSEHAEFNVIGRAAEVVCPDVHLGEVGPVSRFGP